MALFARSNTNELGPFAKEKKNTGFNEAQTLFVSENAYMDRWKDWHSHYRYFRYLLLHIEYF